MASEDEGALAALRDLVQSEGWRLLKDRATVDYGPVGYGHRMQEALNSIPGGPDRPYELARVAEQVDATARAINLLIKWPEEEIARLSPAKVSANPLQRLRRITQ